MSFDDSIQFILKRNNTRCVFWPHLLIIVTIFQGIDGREPIWCCKTYFEINHLRDDIGMTCVLQAHNMFSDATLKRCMSKCRLLFSFWQLHAMYPWSENVFWVHLLHPSLQSCWESASGRQGGAFTSCVLVSIWVRQVAHRCFFQRLMWLTANWLLVCMHHVCNVVIKH